MIFEPSSVYYASANSTTALNVLKGRVSALEFERIKDLVERGIATVGVDSGFVSITYDWTKPENISQQMDMQLDG